MGHRCCRQHLFRYFQRMELSDRTHRTFELNTAQIKRLLVVRIVVLQNDSNELTESEAKIVHRQDVGDHAADRLDYTCVEVGVAN